MDDASEIYSLPFPMWFPFDWKTPLGYFAAFSIQFVSIYHVYISIPITVGFINSSCEMLIAFAKDLKSNLDTIKEISKNKGNQTELKVAVSECIKFHSEVQQNVHGPSETCGIIITSCFLWSLTTICVSLLMMQMLLKHDMANQLDIIRLFCLLCWSIIFMFFLCNSGEKTTDYFERLNDALYECNWYTYPIEIQRMIPTILLATQNPPVLKGHLNIFCTRDTFKKVINSGFSYFMTLRELIK